MNYGDPLKYFRKQLNISQKQLEIVSDVPQNTISLIENQRRAPDLTTIEKICNGVGINIFFFWCCAIRYNGSMESNNSNVSGILKIGDKMLEEWKNKHPKGIKTKYNQ